MEAVDVIWEEGDFKKPMDLVDDMGVQTEDVPVSGDVLR